MTGQNILHVSYHQFLWITIMSWRTVVQSKQFRILILFGLLLNALYFIIPHPTTYSRNITVTLGNAPVKSSTNETSAISSTKNTSLIANIGHLIYFKINQFMNGQNKTDITNPVTAKKLFLFSYMRGGSSIAGELFNCDPEATMWYEPGDAFFSSYYGLQHENLPQTDLYFYNQTKRLMDISEQTALEQFYTNKFTCNFAALPPEALSHYFIAQSKGLQTFKRCRNNHTSHKAINSCKRFISKVCSATVVQISLEAHCHTVISAFESVMKENWAVGKEQELLKFLQRRIKDNFINISKTGQENLLGFVKHGLCVEKLRKDNAKCIHLAVDKCHQDKLRVVQVNRMKMDDMEPLIQANPDLHVVHYTRDPRAILLSRMTVKLTTNRTKPNLNGETQFLCKRMQNDVTQRKILEKKYPGVITQMKYEDLAADPIQFGKHMYSLLNQTLPKQWNTFVSKHMHAKGAGGGFGVSVKNPVETANKWKTKLSSTQRKYIAGICSEVILELGYKL